VVNIGTGTNVDHEFLVQIAWLSRVYASSSAPQSERNPKKFEVKIGDTRSFWYQKQKLATPEISGTKNKK
jgi:hypothetical protein